MHANATEIPAVVWDAESLIVRVITIDHLKINYFQSVWSASLYQ